MDNGLKAVGNLAQGYHRTVSRLVKRPLHSYSIPVHSI
jgi:hypothetical protein